MKSSRGKKKSIVKKHESTPSRYTQPLVPLNHEEQKERFLKYGITPKFSFRHSADHRESIANKKKGEINFELFAIAKRILDQVKQEYGDGEVYLNSCYGRRIENDEATLYLTEYIRENNLDGQVNVHWAPDLTCSAQLNWIGPNQKYNRPELRKYSLWVKSSRENLYLREHGIKGLADHEIGTHFFRSINDGLQPWYSDRKTFGLRSNDTRAATATEEGLASINTLLCGNTKYLWTQALLYYTACMSAEMNFRELFDHLEGYVRDPEQRWKRVMRVKRSLEDSNDYGGYGKDQCYFEGAIEILRNIDNIDFPLLYCGKVCVDELPRVKRLARMDCIRLPMFLKDEAKYKRRLKQIAKANGLVQAPPATSKNNSARQTSSKKRTRSHLQIRRSKTSSQNTPTPPPGKKNRNRKLSSYSKVPPISPRVSSESSTPDRDFVTPVPSESSCFMGSSFCKVSGDKNFVYLDTNGDWESIQESRNQSSLSGATESPLSSPGRLLNRPKSSANKIVKNGKIEMFGTLERHID